MLPRVARTTSVGADAAGSIPRSWLALALWPVAALCAETAVLGRRDV
ncbi:hypothetical protein ACFZBU_15420 [Embleya sp. NPDC008237]